MATRSYIGIEHENGKIEVVYCHFDGYVTGVGLELLIHYKTRERVKELLSFGSISVLDKRITPTEGIEHSFDLGKRQPGVCLFYRRDRGEDRESTRTREWPSTEDMLEGGGLQDAWDIEFIYIMREDRWHLLQKGEFVDLKNLINTLVSKDRDTPKEEKKPSYFDNPRFTRII